MIVELKKIYKKAIWYETQNMLLCYECRQEKDKSEFYTDESRTTGYRPHCKKCDNKKRVERAKRSKSES